MFRVLDILAVKWAAGDFPAECRFLGDTWLLFLKKEEELTTQMFDDTSGSDL